MSLKKLNILFINSIEKTTWGGLENWIQLVSGDLRERGHAITVIGRPQSKFISRISRNKDLEIIELNLSGDFNLSAISQIAKIIGSHKIDLTLCNFVRDVRLSGLARKVTHNFKIIWTPGVNLAKKTMSHYLLFRNFIDGAIVPSRYLRDEIVSSGYLDESKFEIIPIGLDKTRWTLDKAQSREELCHLFNISRDRFVCLTSGRFVSQKGHKFLLEAANVLCPKYRDIRFILLGDGPLEDEIREKTKYLGLENHFVFAGLMEDHRKVIFGADLYVHPAIIEPYGIVLVEAMAAGLPIVATNVGGIAEVVAKDSNALIVDPANPMQLTKAIEKLYNDDELRLNFGLSGRERFESEFRQDKMADLIEKYLVKMSG